MKGMEGGVLLVVLGSIVIAAYCLGRWRETENRLSDIKTQMRAMLRDWRRQDHDAVALRRRFLAQLVELGIDDLVPEWPDAPRGETPIARPVLVKKKRTA